MKKLWISIKRGLIRDPKHRIAMGECVWLYQYMVDIADWETGVVNDWKDDAAAEDMQMPIRTLREQRRKLESLDYIVCHQKQYSQSIDITNWTNPRDYTGVVSNPKQGGNKAQPSENPQGDTQGYIQGDTQGSSQNVTPTSSSNTTNHNSDFLPAKPEIDKVAEWLKMGQFAGAKRETRIDAILSYLGERFHVNTEVKKWKEFAKFVETRQTHHGEQVDVFVSWLLGQKDFNLQYWPPSKMEEFWPMAFIKGDVNPQRAEGVSSGYFA